MLDWIQQRNLLNFLLLEIQFYMTEFHFLEIQPVHLTNFCVRNQISSSGEILPIGNLTRDLSQILQRRYLSVNDPSPFQSEITLVIQEITKTRACMSAVSDRPMAYLCINELGNHLVSSWFVVSSAARHYLSQLDLSSTGWSRTNCRKLKL